LPVDSPTAAPLPVAYRLSDAADADGSLVVIGNAAAVGRFSVDLAGMADIDRMVKWLN